MTKRSIAYTFFSCLIATFLLSCNVDNTAPAISEPLSEEAGTVRNGTETMLDNPPNDWQIHVGVSPYCHNASIEWQCDLRVFSSGFPPGPLPWNGQYYWEIDLYENGNWEPWFGAVNRDVTCDGQLRGSCGSPNPANEYYVRVTVSINGEPRTSNPVLLDGNKYVNCSTPIGCYGPYPDELFTFDVTFRSLTITSSNGGTTSPSSGTYTIVDNDVVTIQANPNPNATFSHWSGSLSGTQNPKTFGVSQNMTATANFYIRNE